MSPQDKHEINKLIASAHNEYPAHVITAEHDCQLWKAAAHEAQCRATGHAFRVAALEDELADALARSNRLYWIVGALAAAAAIGWYAAYLLWCEVGR